ncbi:AAA family ATPase [Aeoliella mucimassa]|uniref:Trifunctional NAD biosynthesis/regulator protein NadR n=1 Tax=Aeoliella mucimassa TaxID=2527972 RepID=A0A518AWG9_9BACT|nr:AAA family ATPase [Aeoliella mucimassa]QDU59063.1 Trifunctional NAD biosynthesis/regulator protein NadR [Aeoliella mucimassa]
MTTGLTLGKFAPLHLGHQAIIERALRENDSVVVLIYDAPEFTPIPLGVRADWIRQLYPSVEVIECWDGPMQVGNTPEIEAMHEQYILRTLAERPIANFYSSEFYGAHVSRALGAHDCRVDEARQQVPISATAIRESPYDHRQFVDPLVYRDLVTWVVLLGAPSTGKTTLCQALADRFRTVWMPEYGREYWEAHQQQRRLTPEQLVDIAVGHREREEQLAHDAREYFFVDTDASTTAVFAGYYHGQPHPALRTLANHTPQRYDLALVCDTDIPYDDTDDRSGEANRAIMQRRVLGELHRLRRPYVLLRGSLADRIEQVQRTLAMYDKWNTRLNA